MANDKKKDLEDKAVKKPIESETDAKAKEVEDAQKPFQINRKEKKDSMEKPSNMKPTEKSKKDAGPEPGAGKVKNEIEIEPEIHLESMSLQEILSTKGRRRLAMAARKNKRRLTQARKKRKFRRADKKRLVARSRKFATKQVRSKVAKQQATNYSDLSPTAKALIDKKVAKRKKAVDRLARRDLPKQRIKDREKTRREEYIPEGKTWHQLFHKDKTVKTDGRFKQYRKADKHVSPEAMINIDQVKQKFLMKMKAKEFNESYEVLKDLVEEKGIDKMYDYLDEKADPKGKKIGVLLKLLENLIAADPKTSLSTHAWTATRQLDIGIGPKELVNMYNDIHVDKNANIDSFASHSHILKKYGF